MPENVKAKKKQLSLDTLPRESAKARGFCSIVRNDDRRAAACPMSRNSLAKKATVTSRRCSSALKSVESGATFADSLKKHPKVFDTLFVNLVAAGELGGILDTILNRLATYIEKNVKLARQVKGAIIYPVAICLVAAGVVTALLKWVIPTFESMFRDFGDKELPALTQHVIAASNWFENISS